MITQWTVIVYSKMYDVISQVTSHKADSSRYSGRSIWSPVTVTTADNVHSDQQTYMLHHYCTTLYMLHNIYCNYAYFIVSVLFFLHSLWTLYIVTREISKLACFCLITVQPYSSLSTVTAYFIVSVLFFCIVFEHYCCKSDQQTYLLLSFIITVQPYSSLSTVTAYFIVSVLFFVFLHSLWTVYCYKRDQQTCLLLSFIITVQPYSSQYLLYYAYFIVSVLICLFFCIVCEHCTLLQEFVLQKIFGDVHRCRMCSFWFR